MEKRYRFASAQRGKSQRLGCGCRLFRKSRSDGIPMHRPSDGAQVFHYGPIHGTNNIGEFLAIVHALALMQQKGITDKIIYSDSVNAQLWVSKKQCKTKLERTPQTEQLYQVIARAENWLRTHPINIPIIKWETKKWGEIPADFGRKG